MAEQQKYKLKCECSICGAINFTASGLTPEQIKIRYAATEKAIALTKLYCPKDSQHFGMKMLILDSNNHPINLSDVIREQKSQESSEEEGTDTITT